MLASLQGWMQGPMHGTWMSGWVGWVWMLFSLLFSLLLVGALIALIRYLWTRTGGPGGRSHGSALEILKERYARGELTREEFQRMRQEIE